jgi:hypothetical protein
MQLGRRRCEPGDGVLVLVELEERDDAANPCG